MMTVAVPLKAQALPVSSTDALGIGSDVTPVAGGCGYGWHWGPWGGCRRELGSAARPWVAVLVPPHPVGTTPGVRLSLAQRNHVDAPTSPAFHLRGSLQSGPPCSLPHTNSPQFSSHLGVQSGPSAICFGWPEPVLLDQKSEVWEGSIDANSGAILGPGDTTPESDLTTKTKGNWRLRTRARPFPAVTTAEEHAKGKPSRAAPPGGGEHFVRRNGVELVESVIENDLGLHAASRGRRTYR